MERDELRNKSEELFKSADLKDELSTGEFLNEMYNMFRIGGFTERQALWMVVDVLLGGHQE